MKPQNYIVDNSSKLEINASNSLNVSMVSPPIAIKQPQPLPLINDPKIPPILPDYITPKKHPLPFIFNFHKQSNLILKRHKQIHINSNVHNN